MKRGAGGAGSSPSSGKDRWADFGFSTPPRGSGRVAVRTETSPSARGGGSRKDRGSDDEEENRGRGATGGTNADDAGSESTPGKKNSLRIWSKRLRIYSKGLRIRSERVWIP